MSMNTTCPSCQRTLRVPESLMGQHVKCPSCNTTFLAGDAGAAPREDQTRPRDDRPRRADDSDRPRRSRDDDYDDRPRRRDRDDDYDDRPRRRRGGAPHRGGLILGLGICAILGVATLITGPMAWIMGNADIKEIRDGRMDPEGESMTNTGRILGMIATILMIVGFVFICLIFGLIGAAGGFR